jgi:hypothetical protein
LYSFSPAVVRGIPPARTDHRFGRVFDIHIVLLPSHGLKLSQPIFSVWNLQDPDREQPITGQRSDILCAVTYSILAEITGLIF